MEFESTSQPWQGWILATVRRPQTYAAERVSQTRLFCLEGRCLGRSASPAYSLLSNFKKINSPYLL